MSSSASPKCQPDENPSANEVDPVQWELEDPPPDIISCVQFAPSGTRLLASSWGRTISLYDIAAPEGEKLLKRVTMFSPMLGVCFGENDDVAYCGGGDSHVWRVDLVTGKKFSISKHDGIIYRIKYSREHNILVTTSKDETIHIHHPAKRDPDQDADEGPFIDPPTAATIKLPAKPAAIAIGPTKLIVGMTQRKVEIYDLQALAMLSKQAAQGPPNVIEVEPFQRRESSLRFQLRAVACMPNDLGYATSSIEGRVAVDWYDASEESQKRKYAFKCHRLEKTLTNPETGQEALGDMVYPVHTLQFHPVHGTLASGGGDGHIFAWDAVAKRRVKAYPKLAESVNSMSFSGDGKYLAITISPSFQSGVPKGGVDDPTKPKKIFIRELGESELKAKAK